MMQSVPLYHSHIQDTKYNSNSFFNHTFKNYFSFKDHGISLLQSSVNRPDLKLIENM